MPISEVCAERGGRQVVVDAAVARASKAHRRSSWSQMGPKVKKWMVLNPWRSGKLGQG